MKKIFSSIMMMAAALFITSCASDDLTSTQTNGEEVAVSFSLGLEGDITTRAISDGTSVDRLMYAVFDSNGDRVSTMTKVDKTVTFPTTEEVTLVKDKSYKIVFWAQDADCDAYGVDDNMVVTVNYANKVNNDERRDAFFRSIDVTVSGPTTIDVELKRALAQINVGVYQEDWDAAVKAGATVTESEAYIKNAAERVNLRTGEIVDVADIPVTYLSSAIPTEDLVVDGVAYKWLSMSYILVADRNATADADGMLGANEATLDDLGFKFKYNGGVVAFESGLTSVPVKRNCRTNIVGKLLTGDAKFNITVDKMFADDLAYPDNLAQQLALAAAAGGTVTLTENVTLDAPLNVKADMVINLNGNTITGTTHKSVGPVIKVNEGASLNISGGTVKSAGEDGGSAIENRGTLTVENATLIGAAEKSSTGFPSYALNNYSDLR